MESSHREWCELRICRERRIARVDNHQKSIIALIAAPQGRLQQRLKAVDYKIAGDGNDDWRRGDPQERHLAHLLLDGSKAAEITVRFVLKSKGVVTRRVPIPDGTDETVEVARHLLEISRKTTVRGVFLSHSSSDITYTCEVAALLKDAGIKDVFLDVWSLEPGDKWRPGISAAITSSNCLVVIVGDSELGPIQEDEIKQFAKKSGAAIGRIIPVALSGPAFETCKRHPILAELSILDATGKDARATANVIKKVLRKERGSSERGPQD